MIYILLTITALSLIANMVIYWLLLKVLLIAMGNEAHLLKIRQELLKR